MKLFGGCVCVHKLGQSDFMNKMLDENRISEDLYDKIARENALKLLKLA